MKRGLFSLVAVLACTSARAATEVEATPRALADAIGGHRVVILGEVHDNPTQHALRAAALRTHLERGGRPAIAFEQFDRERQDAIDRARRERPRDVDHLIAEAKGAPSWKWDLYKPFLALALEYDLPIVAANLSRSDAMKVATDAPSAVPTVPKELLRLQEESIARGHCNLLPQDALGGMARAQIERDRTLAAAIELFKERGVVLLTGNGHARIDAGVPLWLTPETRAATVGIGLLERGSTESRASFDLYVVTDPATRPDPCEELRRRMKPRG